VVSEKENCHYVEIGERKISKKGGKYNAKNNDSQCVIELLDSLEYGPSR
jgi:hypothetical protein